MTTSKLHTSGSGEASTPRWVVFNEGAPRPAVIMLQPWLDEDTKLARLAGQIPDRPFYGILPPSMETLAGMRNIHDLADYMIEQIRALPVEPPYRIFGWSFGGNLSFEVARRLEQDLQFAAMVDTWFPRTYRPLHRSLQLLNRYVSHTPIDLATLRMLARRETGFARIHARVIRKQLRFRLDQFLGRPADQDTFDRLEWFIYTSSWAYAPRPVWTRFTYFSCTETILRQKVNPALDWAPLMPGGFDMVLVPGDHFTIWDEPAVEGFARLFETALRKAEADTPPWCPPATSDARPVRHVSRGRSLRAGPGSKRSSKSVPAPTSAAASGR